MSNKNKKKETEKSNDSIENTPMYTGPIGQYEVVGEIFPLNEDGTQKDYALKIGSVHELPKAAGDQMVSEGTMREIPEIPAEQQAEAPAAEVEALEESEAPAAKLYYRGSLIMGDIAQVEHNHGHLYKTFSTETGETFKISLAEFDAEVTTE